jgi:tetratricopeptide (TPR) repeat protein
MRPRTLFFALVLPLAAQSLRAQSAQLDQTEILGRLAVSYSPSYIAHLVKTRGLNFSPTQDFIYRVKLAGGDGILVDRLSSGDSAPSVVSSADQDIPVHRLAKCAELIHTGAVESAENECRAAIDENPKSPWPLLASASLLQPESFLQEAPPSIDTSKAERAELLQRAAALAPNLALVHRELASIPGSSQAVTEVQKASALDPDQLETTEAANWWQTARSSGLVNAFQSNDDAATAPPASDASITLPPNVLRRMKIEPDLASNHFIAGLQYLQVRNFDQARREFHEAMRLEPDVAAPHLLLATLDFYLHNEESGLAQFRETVRIAPAGTLQHMAVAGALEALGRTPEAINELRATIALHPAAYEPSKALIDLCLAHQDRKSAIAELRRSLDLSSSAFTDQAKFVEVRFADLYQLLNLLAEDRELDAAAQQYLFMLRYKPNDSGLHNDYGNVLLDLHRIDDALGQYNEAIRLDPQMSSAHHNIGLCLASKKNLDGAIQEFRQALELNPNEPHTQVFLGSALGQQGDLKGAMEQFQQAIAKDPKDAEAHLSVAYAFEQLKDIPGAIKELKLTLELKPGSPAAENDLAWICATAADPKFRDPVEALVLARQAVLMSPQPNPAYLDTLAEALLLNGQAAEALANELQAAKLDPENPELQSRLPRFREAANPHSLPKP